VRVDLGQFLPVGCLGRQFSDDLDRYATRDFTGVVAAHAVGEHHKPDIRV